MPEIMHGGAPVSSSTSKPGKSLYDIYIVGATKKYVDRLTTSSTKLNVRSLQLHSQ